MVWKWIQRGGAVFGIATNPVAQAACLSGISMLIAWLSSPWVWVIIPVGMVTATSTLAFWVFWDVWRVRSSIEGKFLIGPFSFGANWNKNKRPPTLEYFQCRVQIMNKSMRRIYYKPISMSSSLEGRIPKEGKIDTTENYLEPGEEKTVQWPRIETGDLRAAPEPFSGRASVTLRVWQGKQSLEVSKQVKLLVNTQPALDKSTEIMAQVTTIEEPENNLEIGPQEKTY